MNLLYLIYICIAGVFCGVMVVMLMSDHLQRRRSSHNRVLREHYLRILLPALVAGDTQPMRFPMLRRAGARGELAEVVAGLCRVTCDADRELLRGVVKQEGLDRWLLRRVERRHGFRRAAALAQLALLPLDAAELGRVARYACARNRQVRFYALLVRLTADPSTALRRIADFGDLFSDCEVAEVMSVLRRGALPIACEPLLESPDRNLRRIGLAIVRQFGVEEAEPFLLRMVAQEPEAVLGSEALYTLCSLHRPLVRQEVLLRLSMMNLTARKAMLRYMATEGYAVVTLERLFGDCERAYCESLVHSYKRSLV